MQQSHAQQNMQSFQQNAQHPPQAPQPVTEQKQDPTNGQSLDDLISEAKQAESSKPAKAADIPDVPKAEPEAKSESIPAKNEDEKAEGKKDKDKSKASKLVYDDNEISPEEKMAKMARYAFTPDRNAIRV
jgi:hypothetical protein